MEEKGTVDIILIIIKIFVTFLIFVTLTFATFLIVRNAISAAQIEDPSDCNYSGLVYAVCHVLLFAANIVLTIISLIGLIIAKLYKSSPIYRKNVVSFRWLSAAPTLAHVLFYLITVIVGLIL